MTQQKEVRKSVGYQQDHRGQLVELFGVYDERGQLLRWDEELVQQELPAMEFKLHADSAAARQYLITVKRGVMRTYHKDWDARQRCYQDYRLVATKYLNTMAMALQA